MWHGSFLKKYFHRGKTGYFYLVVGFILRCMDGLDGWDMIFNFPMEVLVRGEWILGTYRCLGMGVHFRGLELGLWDGIMDVRRGSDGDKGSCR